MNTKLMIVSKAKTETMGKFRPRLRISGLWLNEIGFDYEKLVSVAFDMGYLVFKAHDKGVESYEKIVKDILKNKMKLIQVRKENKNKKTVPCFDVKGLWVNDLGFTIGSIVAVQYEMNLIKVKLIDLSKVTVEI